LYVTPKETPASFSLDNLNISPLEASKGQEISVSTTVINRGGSAGKYVLYFKINDIQLGSQEVSLEPAASQRVQFSTKMDIAGQYTADINGQTGQYVVREVEGQIAELTSTPTAPAAMEAPLFTTNPTLQESTSINSEQSIPTSSRWWAMMLGVILPIILIVGLFAIFRLGKSERETK
jgi:hypothetical protein